MTPLKKPAFSTSHLKFTKSDLQTVLAQIVSWIGDVERPYQPDWPPEMWALFQQAAFIHGVSSILYGRLKAEPLPEPIKTWLAWQYQSNQERVRRMQEELQAILSRFAAAGIPLMPLKGALLTADYYPNIGMRPTADIDLLIRPSDFETSVNLLSHLGYEVEKSNWKHAILSQPNNRAIVSYEVEHADNPRRIDLHVRCQEMFSGPVVELTAEIWAAAAEGQLLGERTWILKPDRLWLHLLLHTSSNIWNGVLRLVNLVDISCVQKTADFEEATLREMLHEKQADARFFYPALYFYHRCWPQQTYQMLVEQCETAVPTSFHHWLAHQNLLSRSRLHSETKWDYLSRILLLYRGRPKDMIAAVRFLPSLLKK